MIKQQSDKNGKNGHSENIKKISEKEAIITKK